MYYMLRKTTNQNFRYLNPFIICFIYFVKNQQILHSFHLYYKIKKFYYNINGLKTF
jgi:hypothetical protein